MALGRTATAFIDYRAAAQARREAATPWMRSVARAVHHRIDLMVASILEAVRCELPEYGVLATDGLQTSHEESIRHIATLIVEHWMSGEPLAQCQLARLREVGTRRAEQRVSADALRKSIQVAGDTGWDFVIETAEKLPANPALTRAIGAMATDLFGVLQQIASAMLTGHMETTVARQPPLHVALADVLSAAAPPDGPAENVVLSRLDPNQAYGLLVIPDRAGADASGSAAALAAGVAEQTGGMLFQGRAGDELHVGVLVTAAAWTTACRIVEGSLHASGKPVVACPPVKGLDALRDAYRNARRALPFTDCLGEAGALVDVARGQPHALLSVVPREMRTEALRAILGPVLDHPRQMAVVNAICRHNGRTAPAARSLGVTERAVRRHVNTIEGVLGVPVTSGAVHLAHYLYCLADLSSVHRR